MARFYELCIPIPKDERDPDGDVRWHRIGTGWYDRDKDRMTIKLDSLPTGGRRILGFPNDGRGGKDVNKSGGTTKKLKDPPPPPPDDDDIPF